MIFERIFREFQGCQLDYAIIGGVAVNLHGYARFTADLDIVIALSDEELNKFVLAIKNLGMIPRLPVQISDLANQDIRNMWINEKNMAVFSVYNPQNPKEHIDLMIDNQELFETILKNRVIMKFGNLDVPIASIPDIIQLKKIAGRERDFVDIRALEKIQELKHGK